MIISSSDRLSQVKSYYFARKLAQIRQMNENGLDVINLGIGSPDLKPPKDSIEQLHAESLLEDVNMYQPYKGIPEFRNAFAEWYWKYYQVVLDPEREILPLIGSKEGIMHISMSFLNPGDAVLVPNPGYIAYAVTAKLAGANALSYDLNESTGWLPNLKSLSNMDLTQVKIMWVNYPHMPTGAQASREFFDELLEFGKDQNILICHDNPYSFILNDKPLSILKSDANHEASLELNSLSKSYNMAGWRVGVVCGGESYIDTIMTFKSNMDSGMYRGIQKAAIAALQSGANWFEQLNEIYFERRRIVWDILQVLGCQFEKSTAGLFVWGKVPDHIHDVENWVEQILQEARVFVTPGFIFGSNGERYIRISLCQRAGILERARARASEHMTALKSKL